MNIREYRIDDDRVPYSKLKWGTMFTYYNKIYIKLNRYSSVNIETGIYRYFIKRLPAKVRKVTQLIMVADEL